MTESTAFKNLQMESAKNTIIDNLKVSHQAKLVNILCATNGLVMNTITFAALNELTNTNVVEIESFPIMGTFGNVYYAKMYRYNIFR